MHSFVRIGVLAAAAAFSTGAYAASAENGRKAYANYGCWSCHGYEGQGGVTGPKLAPDPLPQEGFNAFVRTTNQQMPPYHESVLPDGDLADIYAFLQSQPKAADPKTIPLLNP
jgi:mono/diheme cytochrome c family protein